MLFDAIMPGEEKDTDFFWEVVVQTYKVFKNLIGFNPLFWVASREIIRPSSRSHLARVSYCGLRPIILFNYILNYN
jgi:hypothetical protein